MAKIIGIGEVLFDVFPNGRKLGGAPVNFAYHVNCLGEQGLAVTAVGNDELGKEAKDLMKEKKIDGIISTVESPTGTAVVALDDEGVPSFTITEGVAWDVIPFSDELKTAAASCDAICFGTLAQRSAVSRNTVRKVLSLVPESSLVVYDINLRQHYYSKSLVEESLKLSNVLKINDDEFRIVRSLLNCPYEDYESESRWLMNNYGLKMLILTCGAEGSYVFSEDSVSFEPTPKVKVVDTVGAGDSFTAAFCVAFLRGLSIKEAHKKAVEVSAFVCTRAGAMPEMPKLL